MSHRPRWLLAALLAFGVTLGGADTALGATANGSHICDSDRASLTGNTIDASYTLTDNNTLIIYAAGANDDGIVFETDQTHTLQYREPPSGGWTDVPTSNETPTPTATGPVSGRLVVGGPPAVTRRRSK